MKAERLQARFLVALLCAALSAAVVPARADQAASREALEQKATLAYRDGHYQEAIDIWRPLAAQGDVEASRNLAYAYENGFGVTKDLNEALKRYEQAAQGGSVPAQYRAGLMYLTGETGRQDFSKAFALLQNAAQGGHPAAQYNLGVMYEQGVGTAKNNASAAEWFAKAATAGHDKALVKLQKLKAEGGGTATAQAAMTPLEKAAASAGLSAEQKAAQSRFVAREQSDRNRIQFDEKQQAHKDNPFFFGTERDVKNTQLPAGEGVAATRPARLADTDSTGNPFDPARLPDPKRPANGMAGAPEKDDLMLGSAAPMAAPTDAADLGKAGGEQMISTGNNNAGNNGADSVLNEMAAAQSQASVQAKAIDSGKPKTVRTPKHEASTLFAEGRRLYRAGRHDQALELWQRAADAGHTPALAAIENARSHLASRAEP